MFTLAPLSFEKRETWKVERLPDITTRFSLPLLSEDKTGAERLLQGLVGGGKLSYRKGKEKEQEVIPFSSIIDELAAQWIEDDTPDQDVWTQAGQDEPEAGPSRTFHVGI